MAFEDGWWLKRHSKEAFSILSTLYLGVILFSALGNAIPQTGDRDIFNGLFGDGIRLIAGDPLIRAPLAILIWGSCMYLFWFLKKENRIVEWKPS